MTVTYSKDTGSSGEMQIRDTGTRVEFWLNSHNSTTFNHDLPWGRTVNGDTNNSFTFDYYANAGWKKLGDWSVTTSQTVVFRIFDTGTSGFGGPTTFSQFIDRSTVPAAPSTPVLSAVGSTSVTVTFTDGSNGGAAIDSRRIGYGTSSSAPTTYVSSDGSDTISGLTPGTTYYFWAQTHNAKGYSALSGRSSTTTLRVPDAPSTPVVSDIGPTSMTLTWVPNGDGGSAITGYQLSYGTDPAGVGATVVSATSPKTVTGLSPGVKYYFAVRAQNVVGNGPYSAFSNASTVAGARIKVSGVYKFAIPYIKVSGVWKLAQPFVKAAGVWKETI